MLTRLLQAIAITSAVYLTMMTYQSSSTSSALVSPPHTTVGTHRLSHLIAEVLDFLRPSPQPGTTRHRASVSPD